MRSAIIAISVFVLGCAPKKETSEEQKAKATPTDSKRADEAHGGPAEHQANGDKTHERSETSDDNAPTRIELKNAAVARIAGLQIIKATDRPEGAGIVLTASIAFDATKRAVINARAPGIVRTIKCDVGAKVEAGTALALIESVQVGADRSRISGARARVQVAEANYRRESELQSKGISAMKDLLAAQQELQAAKSELASLTASLGAVGQNAGVGGGYALVTPLAGIVVRRTAVIGKLVGVDETLFEIVDTGSMWAEIDVPEDQIVSVAIDQPLIVTVDGLGDRQFRGVIAYVSPEIDPRTRTARARATLQNLDGALRANMFAHARIVTGAGTPTVTVPSKAVQRIGDESMVFVRISEREYEARPVELGADDGATVEITKGVHGGDDVVAQGAFLLKSEILKGSIKGDDD